jgi:hypothetical protein
MEQDGRDLPPLLIRGDFWMGLVGAPVPVSSIVRVTLFTMQVGVDPGRFLIGGVFLREVMSTVKISLSVPPKSLQQRR